MTRDNNHELASRAPRSASKRWRPGTRRASAAGVGATLAFCVLPSAIAQTRWTPQDNNGIAFTQGALTGAHITATIGGLALGPLGTPFEIAAFASDVGLKSTPPVFRPPPDLLLSPNSPATGSAMPSSCVYRFQRTVPSDGRTSGIETDYGGVFYIPYNPVDDVFKDLGKPFVYHAHASGIVSVDNLYLSRAGYAQYTSATQRALEKLPEFPEGTHALEWQAGTRMNGILDVAVPGALIAVFAYAESRLAAKSAAAAGKKSDDILKTVQIGSELGLIAGDLTDPFNAHKWYQDTSFTTAINSATQTLTVWDEHVPYLRNPQTGAARFQTQDIELEATDFGGVRLGRVADALGARFEPVDDCARQFETRLITPEATLLKVGGTQNVVTWETRELGGGPYRPSVVLGANQRFDGTAFPQNVITTLTQRVTVVDTQAPILVPPAGFARYSATPVDLATSGPFPLGRPRVVDLADPEPTVTNDAPAVLDVGRRYLIDWQARDATGNTTPPAQQVVTVKAPGTNTAPVAEPKSAATLTSMPVEVLLTGVDDDLLDGRVDPLAFEIVQHPPKGQFEAPLLPYFIEDFRLSPVGEREDQQTLARTSPLKHLASAFQQASRATHGTFLTQQICDAPAGSLNRTEFNGVIPVNFVYEPTYVHVDDAGFYYVRDKFWVCGEPNGSGLDYRDTLSPIPRLSKWSDDGALVAMAPLYPTASPVYSDTNLNTNTWPADDFSVDQNGRLWFQFRPIFTTFGQARSIYSVDSNLGEMRFHGTISFDETEVILGRKPIAIAGDTRLGLLFELNGVTDGGYCPGGTCVPGPFDDKPLLVRAASLDLDLSTDDRIIGALPVDAITSFKGVDIEVDTHGNVYVLDKVGNRVHKFGPTVRNDAGEWEVGEYVGWMGSCSANLLDPNGVPYNGCDEELGVSRGYACRDATCGRAATTSGAAPGQFNAPENIEIDPRDILYVADTANSRVQRFGPDGTFAGEAKSTGSGINQGADPGFVLGNMGQPKVLAVNSSSFYVMELDAQSGDNFVHVFKTLPFYDVTDASAKVKYVSTFDFQGTDTFTYRVNDGIDRSAPVPVDVTVARAFRAPDRLRSQCFADDTLGDEVACNLPEDGSIVIRFSAHDLDGFLSTGGLDRLTFNVVEAPVHGTLAQLSTTDNAAVYRYTPAANFNGGDSLVFDVSDGTLASLEQKAIALTIEPTPDPVTIEFPANLRAARGFRQVVSASYSDIDADLASAPKLMSLQWGDGTGTSAPSWAGSGRPDTHGREINPQEDFGLGRGVLIESHTYGATGSYVLRATMANAPAENLPDTIATANLEVIEATVVGVELDAPAASVTPDTTFPLVLDVTNHAPAGWAGLAARNTRVSFAVPQGLALAALDDRCTAGTAIVCELGDLDPGQVSALTFEAEIALAAARAQTVYDLDVQIEDAGPKVQAQNVARVAVRVADRDGDGSIDVDDAFPDDARYSVDADGDGLPDNWELAHGFDPTVADDAGLDDDGDGFTAAQELLNGSFPFLGERQTARAAARLETTGAAEADLFGIWIAGGDLNQDGYDDTVSGAPGYGGGAGAAFISYGSADGANPALERIGGSAGVTSFGRTVAVADFDGNGYPDAAFGSVNAVSIHMNNGRILAAPDLVLTGATAQANLGLSLGAGDLDGDGRADLVVGGVDTLQVYFSRRGFAAPLTFAAQGTVSSAAVADIDGDAVADLVIGVGGQVHGYLGAHNDWQTATTLTRSFALVRSGVASFGFSLASGADIHGDGIADLVVGAYEGGGEVLVYDSRDGYWNAPALGGTSTVPPDQVITGAAASITDGFGDQLGVRVALGHLDTDPYADVVAGGNRAGVRDAGQIRIFRGGPAGLASPQIEAGAADFDLLGYYVAIPGDVNGDGFADVAAGAPRLVTTQNPTASRGHVRIYEHAFVANDPAEDPDDDGVRASVDNCPAAANTDQADLDADGAGDVCDDDADGDGFTAAVDACPLLASSDQTNSDADSLGDLCDDDDDNDDVPDVDDRFPLDERYAADDDDDGLPNEYETAHGLNPADGADAGADLDADGRSNLDEFLDGTDIAADDMAPQVTPPADVVVSSTGAYTHAALGAATATDVKDGVLTATVSDPGPYAPGRHTIEWRARDAAGNEATAIQHVDVIPRVDFLGATQYAGEGAIVTVTAKLNGPAVSYPVTVPYTLGGSATQGVDYSVSGSLEIVSGDAADLLIGISMDAAIEGDETIVVTSGTPLNAVAGSTTEHVVRIVEANRAPRVSIGVAQAGEPRATILPTAGPVTLTVTIDDANIADTHAIDWSSTEGVLAPTQGVNGLTYTFDPSALSAGLYAARVRVTDSGAPGESASVERLVRVVTEAPALAAGVDTDGDGVDDATEGLTDVNQNGIDDFLEPTTDINVLAAVAGTRRVLEARAGLRLALGATALATGPDASVSLADIAAHGSGGAGALNAADDRFDYPTGLYDFEVHGLAAAGDSTEVAIALPAALPAEAYFRKYVADLGWQDFEIDARNGLASAPGTPDACPAPGSAAYAPGLAAGDRCLQLTIEDGGPNDADGEANGVIVDPGGTAVVARPPTVHISALASPNTTVGSGTTGVVLLRVRLTSDSTDVVLTRLTLAAAGSGNDAADVRAVRLWVDANRSGTVDAGDAAAGTGAYQTDNGSLQLQLSAPLMLPPGDTELLVVYDF